jgi:hypothetical protein
MSHHGPWTPGGCHFSVRIIATGGVGGLTYPYKQRLVEKAGKDQGRFSSIQGYPGWLRLEQVQCLLEAPR